MIRPSIQGICRTQSDGPFAPKALHVHGLRLGLLAAAMVAGGGMVPEAGAQDAGAFPVRPVRLIVPFPPGGSNDLLARAVAQRLTEVTGQQVVVDNRGGAGGLVGATLVATSVPDGYTMLLASLGNLAVNPALQKKPAYDGLKDFAPVTLLATSVFMLVAHPAVPVKGVPDLIALAKAKPGALNYGSAGVGSSLHLTGEIFKHAAGVDLVHVAYKGTGPAITELIGGQVQLVFSTMSAVLPHVKSAKLRALGTSGSKRAAAAPDVPTIAEGGLPGFEVLNWQGLVVPARTPAAVVQKLNAATLQAMKMPGMAESLVVQGLDPAPGTPEAFGAYLKVEIPKYAKIIRAAGIRSE